MALPRMLTIEDGSEIASLIPLKNVPPSKEPMKKFQTFQWKNSWAQRRSSLDSDTCFLSAWEQNMM
jgi:hypothetical protein